MDSATILKISKMASPVGFSGFSALLERNGAMKSIDKPAKNRTGTEGNFFTSSQATAAMKKIEIMGPANSMF
jgi:hypothetical protein